MGEKDEIDIDRIYSNIVIYKYTEKYIQKEKFIRVYIDMEVNLWKN